MTGGKKPRFVDAILDWRPLWFLARLALVSAYLLGGLVKATDWPSAIAEQVHFGMSPPAFWAMPAGQERFIATNAFFEHIGLVGGFILVAIMAQRERRRA